MGSRAQVLIEDEGVYLYTHWGSATIEEDLKKWIPLAKGRWKDPEYFARVIFSNMIREHMDGETGFGIGGSEHGDIDTLITINCEQGSVRVRNCYSGAERFYKSFNGFLE
jgi:hypothetical protein